MINDKTKFSRRLVPIAWAGVLAYATWPLAERIRRWCNNRYTLAVGLTTGFLALTIFLPLIWLLWLAQKEQLNLYPALHNFLDNPHQLPEALRNFPWLGEWLVQQQAQFADHPQGSSATVKAWFSSHVVNESARRWRGQKFD